VKTAPLPARARLHGLSARLHGLSARSSTRSKAIGDGALAVVTDVTKRGDVEHLAKAAIERFGRIDVWVNNAGRGISRSVADLVDDDLDEMWRDNMKSVVYRIQAVLPYSKSRNAGQIVNRAACRARRSLPCCPKNRCHASSSLTTVIVEQAAETRSTADRTGRRVVVGRRGRGHDDLASESLVVALGQVMTHELLEQVS
jgi:NADP-dependent 3-hydroxy acid dehydrogenase YdfG